MRRQLDEKARQTDYAANIDMSAKSQIASPKAINPAGRKAGNPCSNCGHAAGAAKFCPECGTPVRA